MGQWFSRLYFRVVRRVCIHALVGTEVEKLVSISGIDPTAACLFEGLVLIYDRLCDQVRDLRKGQVPTFLGWMAFDDGLEVVHRGGLVDQI